jgi:CheY-like chemotaxis protein
MADTILMVDPSGGIPAILSGAPAFRIAAVRSAGEALEGLHQPATALLLVDENLGCRDAEDLVSCARNVRPELPVVVMAEPGNMDRAMALFQTTVTDYINKPVSPVAVSLILRRSAQRKNQTGMTALGARLAPVAHGVYGMLTALDGGFYQLESGLAGKKPQRIETGLKTVRSYSYRLRHLVMDILEYVRAEHIRTRPVEMSGVARSVLDAVVPGASRAGVAVDVNISPDAGVAVVDPMRFQAALERLLRAAVADTRGHVTDGGARVGFSLKPVPGGQMRFEIRLPDSLGPLPADGTGLDTTLNRLSRFVACHIIRQQGGVVQGDDAIPAVGWRIDIQEELKGKPSKAGS